MRLRSVGFSSLVLAIALAGSFAGCAGVAPRPSSDVPVVRAPAQASPRDWSERVSYERFEDLVRLKVSQIPELALLWKFQATRREGSNLFFGGGLLRGLLRWLDLQLSTHDMSEVEAVAPPGIAELSTIRDADKDIFTLNWNHAHLKANGYGDWDILGQDFYLASEKAGGSTIEKVRVNPTAIEDRFGALRAFYEGRLEFYDAPSIDFEQFRGSTGDLSQNSKTALILRHLRFSVDLPRARIADSAWTEMRKVVAREAQRLKKGNYWIEKALWKLYLATGEDANRTVALLDQAGLVELLGKLNYGFGPDYRRPSYSLAQIALSRMVARERDPDRILKLMKNAESQSDDLLHFFELKPTLAQVQAFKKRSGLFTLSVRAVEYGLEHATTMKEFLEALDPGVKYPSDEYRDEIRRLAKAHLTRLETLPMDTDTYTKILLATDVESIIASKEKRLDSARTATEWLNIADYGLKNPSDFYKDATSDLIAAKVNGFVALGPSRSEIARFKKIFDRISPVIALMKALIERAESAAEILFAFEPGIKYPAEAYLEAIREVAGASAEKFASLNPTRAQVKAFKQGPVTINAVITMVRALLPKAKSRAEFQALIAPDISSPSAAYLNALNQVANEFSGHYASLPEKASIGERWADCFRQLRPASR